MLDRPVRRSDDLKGLMVSSKKGEDEAIKTTKTIETTDRTKDASDVRPQLTTGDSAPYENMLRRSVR